MRPALKEGPADYSDTPQGWAQRWQVELKAARDAVKKWHEQGERIYKRYHDEREGDARDESRWNLFTANVQTQEALLYGRPPSVSVERRFTDARDDLARVAAELLQRLLNADIERDGDSYAEALGHALQDRLLPGLGTVRIRYVVEMEKLPDTPPVLSPDGRELAPAVPGGERKSYECVETDYVYWADFLWSPARVWSQVRWVSFRAEMSKEQVAERFGEDIANRIPYELTTCTPAEREEGVADPWARAVVWEIWDKGTKRVFWYVEGFEETLDDKPDTLQLPTFFPCARPMVANPINKKFLPRPDYLIAEDLYDEVNLLSTRIKLLTDAVKVVGVYDSANAGLKSLLSSTARNQLFPVDNWAMFAEKGGIRGTMDMLPLEPIVNAIGVLVQRREEAKAALYEVTGMSDLLRGQAAAAGVSATEQAIKARFGSVRIQRLQDDFARFAAEVQRLKAAVIAKHYDAAHILEYSNAAAMWDEGLAMQAAELIRSDVSKYRVEVKPENVSLQDFAQLQSERTGMLQALTAFMTGAAPLAQQMPGSLPFLLQMLQWFVAGQRGASQIEGVLDQAVMSAQQMAQQPQQAAPPDPKLQVAQLKAAADLQKVDAESRARVVEIQAETQAAEIQERNQMRYNVQEAAAKQQIAQANRPEQTPGAQPRGLG